MTIIELRNVFKDFINKKMITHVLKDISISINKGEFCVITGPSGSGKTTLLYVMSGLEKCSSGEVLLFNKITSLIRECEMAGIRKRKIGFVFQFYNLLPNLTVYENIMLAKIIAGNEKDNINEILGIVDLENRKNFFPNQLSGGEQQRVAVARAIINDPDIIFADEPTGNLDVAGSLVIMNLFKKLHTEYGKTVILVTHDKNNLKFCTRHISLLDGNITGDENILL